MEIRTKHNKDKLELSKLTYKINQASSLLASAQISIDSLTSSLTMSRQLISELQQNLVETVKDLTETKESLDLTKQELEVTKQDVSALKFQEPPKTS
jgi:predicted  nucleic acid-binding Zn-ribbon protein